MRPTQSRKTNAVQVSRNVRIGALGAAISALAVVFIITQLNLSLFVDALLTARYEYVLPCLFFLVLGLLARAFRWQALLNRDLSYWRTFHIMNIAYLVNGVLPLRIGEVARMFLASRGDPGVPVPRTAGTILIERLLDLLAVVVMILLALTVAPIPSRLQDAGAIAALSVIVGFVVLLMLARQRSLLHRLTRWLIERWPLLRRVNLDQWVDDFLDGLLPLTNPRAFVEVMTWNVIGWVFSVMAGYTLMFAFFAEGQLAATMLYIAAVALAIALPAVPASIGTYEASVLLALVAMGFEQSSTAVAFAIMVHAVNVFVHAATGVIGFIAEGISLEQLTRGVQQMRQDQRERQDVQTKTG